MLQYASTNILIAYIIISLADYDYPRNIIIFATTCLVAFLLAFRLLGAGYYLLKYGLLTLCCKGLPKEVTERNRKNGEIVLQALKKIED